MWSRWRCSILVVGEGTAGVPCVTTWRSVVLEPFQAIGNTSFGAFGFFGVAVATLPTSLQCGCRFRRYLLQSTTPPKCHLRIVLTPFWCRRRHRSPCVLYNTVLVLFGDRKNAVPMMAPLPASFGIIWWCPPRSRNHSSWNGQANTHTTATSLPTQPFQAQLYMAQWRACKKSLILIQSDPILTHVSTQWDFSFNQAMKLNPWVFRPRPYPLLGLHLNMSLWASLGHETHFVIIINK